MKKLIILIISLFMACHVISVNALSYDAEMIISKMTLEEKADQMLMADTAGLGAKNTVLNNAARKTLKAHHVGGIIMFSENITSKKQIRKLTSSYQKISTDIPLFMSVDEEGGQVSRLGYKLKTYHLSPMYYYRHQGSQKATKNAKLIAKNLKKYGFNLDFAPVADIWSNKKNKVIGTRAYSDSFKQGAILVSAAVKGFHHGGVACTLKHFPGHGNTYGDSHVESVYANKTLAQLKKQEFIPFVKGMKAGADMVMVGHITNKKIDRYPASLSYKWITKILRNDLGYQGVVITDSLKMSALTKKYSEKKIIIQAVNAGNDLLLMPQNINRASRILCQAVQDGKISEKRINESVRRILTLKLKRKIMK